MTKQHRELIGILLALLIVALAIYIVQRFIPSMLWAAVVASITYPLYERWLRVCRFHSAWAATSFTGVVSIALVIPLIWMGSILVHEAQVFINYLIHLNNKGLGAPLALKNLPMIGREIDAFWKAHFSEPGGIRDYLSSLNLSLVPVSYYAKKIGTSVLHRSFQFGFMLLSLFFFYRDGEKWIEQVHKVGDVCLGERWQTYAMKLPSTLRGTLNGTVVVGLGVGIIMGLVYMVLSFPAPALAGFATAVSAMIPFVVPFVFGIVALILWLTGSLLKAVIVLVIGTIVMFIADHFVKPVLIGGTTELHFLAVLFGILGGVEAFGLIGLFLGPVVMVLLMILWRELQHP